VADFLNGIGPVANQRLEAVTSEHVLKHREQLESEGRAPATVNFTVKRVLKRAFKAAIDEGIITRNPCATVRLIQDRGKADKHVFSPEQVSKLIEAAEGDWKGLINQRVLHGWQTVGFGSPDVVEHRPFAEQEGHSVHAEEDEGQDAQSESRNPDP
jgi:site-specific recombinase XerD